MAQLTDLSWWKAAAARAARTAAVVAIPYVPLTLEGGDYFILGSVALMGAILSLLTSLVGIAESQGKDQPWWYAALSRTVKTVAQALLTAATGAVLFTDVDWSAVPALVISAAVGSLLLAVVQGVPEAAEPIAAPSGATQVEIVSVAPAAAADVSAATQPVAIPTQTDYHGE